MVLAASGFLEKKVMIPLASVTLGEEEASLFSDALLVTWYSWGPFLFTWLDWGASAVILVFLVFADLPVC